MTPAKAPFLAPQGFPAAPVKIAENGRNASPNYVSGERKAPNAGLLWQRYLPAHDSKEIDPGAGRCSSPGGVDFEARAAETARMRQTNREEEKAKRTAQNTLKAAPSAWAGLGVINWFIETTRFQTCRQRSYKDLVIEAVQRRRALLAGAQWLAVQTLTRACVGLALPATIENSGISLHHTYGFPIFPGSSLKGLARHFLLEEFEAVAAGPDGQPLNKASAKKTAERLWGSTDRSGIFDIADAWPAEPVEWFAVDVITPHHKEYYGRKAGKLPDDTLKLNPLHFLCIKEGIRFSVPIMPKTPATTDADLAFVKRVLGMVLREWGVGGRTGPGYGLCRTVDDIEPH